MTADPSPIPPRADAFVTTRWTRILAARGESAEARAALSDLCAAYYAPVFAFIRRDGRDEDAARELTQEFFHRLLARPALAGVEPGRGRFRSYLLGAVKHFLGDVRDRARTARRGGGLTPLPLDSATDTATELLVPDPNAGVDDRVFDREWALALVRRCVDALAAEATRDARQTQFETLKPWLLGEVGGMSQAELARLLSMSEGAVKVAIHRLRKRFRELVHAEIAETVDHPEQVREEMTYLVEVLSHA